MRTTMATENNNKTLNVPNLRFPEFSGEWTKTKLGDIGTTLIGLTYSPKDVVPSGGTIVLRSSNIKGGLTDYNDIVRVNKKIKESIITRVDDLLICARNGSARLIGKNAILKQEDCGHTFGAFMMVYRAQNNKFVHQLLNTKRYYSQVGENLGARINQITTSDLNSFEFYFPQTLNEQNKIASMLSLLDDRIATQIKIIEKLESLIRGIVETHYSQCECINQVRISELGEPFSTMNMSKEDLSEEGNECILYGELFTTYGCVIKEVKSRTHISTNKATVSQSNDLLFPASTTVDAMSLIAPSAICKEGVILGGDLFGVHVNKNYNNEYLSYLINYIYKSKLARYAQGSTIIHLHYSDIKNATLLLPTIEEQNYLAHIMRVVEEKINIEKDMLSKLYSQKAYLLSNLFI